MAAFEHPPGAICDFESELPHRSYLEKLKSRSGCALDHKETGEVNAASVSDKDDLNDNDDDDDDNSSVSSDDCKSATAFVGDAPRRPGPIRSRLPDDSSLKTFLALQDCMSFSLTTLLCPNMSLVKT
ncbi:hypothetical protein CAOG_04956 [Capsaspora owczarzaki ATCC 30864]|uniref:Uncharacterized protein n=1 Tax=Capsaspora owczarzaki (strain ATCC 30864) TaxID=595528 RepID=A0A0D2WSA4_CAPO3|nr:hypothetical protein CAOG_04956 [Capsaspora owczarzaki ATCC 30864]KJE94288.1 hypothetical protein CAOG_004956 [Capsaspora owczarzaki ATCC 30864]|eukprot:XP_004347707.1 hypothetical protein CAOG_04956 [Capsaspora owczarzaki ATCC 30864]